MVGLDDNFAVMGEWLDCSSNHRKRSKPEFDRNVSLESKSDIDRNVSLEDIKKKYYLQTNYQQGGLSERIATRAGFSVPRLDTKDIIRSSCLTISSPGVSPATLLDSPVFLSNYLLSPTIGKLSSVHYDKAKEESLDDITRSFDPTNISLGTIDCQDIEQTQMDESEDSIPSGAPADDGYNWRKYGQKLVKGSEYPRSYYKCTHPNCEVKKKVERSREGHITEIIYAKAHNHPKPLPNRRSSGRGLDGTEQTEQEVFAGTNENLEWTSPVSAEVEYGSMQAPKRAQFGYGDVTADTLFKEEEEEDRTSHMGYNGEEDESESKRRKLDTEMTGSSRTSREPKVVMQTTSDFDILEDGYRWRKYGQKVVKGNPNPRSYYKCTASGCIVTKHVERASDDITSVITTYIGKHTHDVPAARNSSHTSSALGTIQGSFATQTNNHRVHYPVPQGRPEGMVTANNPSLFDFQRLHSDFPTYIGQTQLMDLSIPSLAMEQEMLPSLPESTICNQAGMMFNLASEPKMEPVSPQEFGMSTNSWIYRDIMSRLPYI